MMVEMKKSVFAKYFTICIAFILVSITFLGAMLMLFASQYFKDEKYRTLLDGAQKAAAVTYSEYEAGEGTVSLTTLRPFYQLLAAASDSQYFLTDNTGKTLFCSEGSSCDHTTHTVPGKILDIAAQGSYREIGTLDGITQQRNFTVAVPLINDNNLVVGFVFGTTDSNELTRFLMELLKMFLLSSAGVLLLTFVVLYFVTLKLVNPLRDMAAAAKQYGRGDFSRRLNVETFDEVGQLAEELNNMAQSLSGVESARRSFVANVSHELKTPMTSIGGFIDGILDGTIPKSEERKYLQIVSDEVKRLSRLVRSMLELSKIETGEAKVNTKQFNIVELVCQTVFSFEQPINNKHLDIRGLDHDRVMVEADEDLIHQVIYNLTDNAVKFVNDGGYIEFSYTSDSNYTYVTVRNSGQGLSKEEISKVFDRFYKTDRSRGLDKNGVGLGLYIVRTIVNLHGGDIVVRSAEGEYCEFTFSLPQPKQNKFGLSSKKVNTKNE